MTKPKTIEIPGEFRRLFDRDWREAAIYGGRYSLKSHTFARFLLIRARQEQTKIGCFREYQNSIADSSHQLLSDLIEKYELTDFKVTEKEIENKINGSSFIFKGLHNNSQSIKSIEGLDIAWVEEAQTVSKESLEILTPTVRKPGSQIGYTYNRLLEDDPVHQRLVIEGRPNTLIINVNYDIALKYKMIPDVILAEIEDDKINRPALYKHKWLGEPNSLERKIYKDWNIIDEIPHEARLERYGLDFGFSNDPTAIVAIYRYNGGYIVDEILCRKGMQNKDIADVLKNLPEALVVADSAEPKSIAEIRSYGVNIVGAKKQADRYGKEESYVKWSIGQVQIQRMSITRRSENAVKAYKGYFWMIDKDGRILNTPDHYLSDCMDAIRYGIVSLVEIIRANEYINSLPIYIDREEEANPAR